VAPGSYVVLAVSDTGVGMDAATRERAFEPFFTTKEKGKGTGLGLSTVFGIVKQSQGQVRIESEPGRGTIFRVYLPRLASANAPLASPSSVPPPVSLQGSETILLVEDDGQLREAMVRILRQHGYTVLDAQNGGEALLICEQHAGPIQLLVSDALMPRMSGLQLAERLRQLRPGLPVLFVSGHDESAAGLPPTAPWLEKPFTPEMLARRVRALLDQSARDPLKVTG
jgi:CheY-like chemotaxis protein